MRSILLLCGLLLVAGCSSTVQQANFSGPFVGVHGGGPVRPGP